MIAAEWCNVREVLVVRLDNLGDVLMTGPALRSLKAGLPDSRITLLASPGGAQAAALLPWVDRVIEHRALWQDLGSLPFAPRREYDLVERLARAGFDAAIIFTSFSQTPHAAAYACYLAGIPLRTGTSKEFAGGVLSHELRIGPEADGLHQVDRNMALLEPLGFDVSDRRLAVDVPWPARRSLDRILDDTGVGAGSPLIVACPWASCPARTYRSEDMVAAARGIGEASGYRVALTGTPRHRAELERVPGRLREGLVDLVGRLDFAEFAALVERAVLLLTNNSGPLHLAEATGTPSVVLYAGTDLESQWKPRFGPARLLRRPTACHPCYAFDCPVPGHPCLEIPVDEVIGAGLGMAREKRDHATPA
ncbi:MAG: glycosyltransferase family 9 protein [Trueperaceae bacterium]